MKKILFLFVLIISSCDRYTLKSLYNAEIYIPNNLETFRNGERINIDTNLDRLKLVLFYDSPHCSSCTINNIYYKEKLYQIYPEEIFYPYIIISPGNNYKEVIMQIQHQKHPFCVFIDKNGYFNKYNNKLSNLDSRYHSLLLDRNNRIVLVGDPTSSSTMWNLFKRTLDNMIANNGIYIPDKEN